MAQEISYEQLTIKLRDRLGQLASNYEVELAMRDAAIETLEARVAELEIAAVPIKNEESEKIDE